MARSSANINSPEIIKRLRGRFVDFDSKCRQALTGVHADVRRLLEWLKREQGPYWRQQFRRREEAAEKARREYASALHGRKHTRKVSVVDEKKALDRAMRLKEEAEEKLKAVRKWVLAIEHRADKLRQPCITFSSLLASLTPRALARLDQMLDSLDEYLRPDGPAGGGGAAG